MRKQKPTKVITGNYTTTDSDCGYRLICNSSTAITITLHDSAGRYNFDIEIVNKGAGVVTCNDIELRQNAHAHVGCDGTNWVVAVSVSSASDIDYDNTTSGMTAENVQAALDEVFTFVSNGKTLIAAAITDKGVDTAATDSFSTMAANISNISGGDTTAKGIQLFNKANASATGSNDNLITTVPSLPTQSITVSVV